MQPFLEKELPCEGIFQARRYQQHANRYMFGDNVGGFCLNWDYGIGGCLDDYLSTATPRWHHG
jgi:hypothetical protein